eukprot:TRINITY_DN568_c0_g3_i2.p1 TRINITY_DN568_c0_g3~~TRINITY_DN568_c0_g3_i2.p1  ORF type:complete len:104 (-),score=39.27 TRINITY_DN568_c0_g3_i2:345-656(-)
MSGPNPNDDKVNDAGKYKWSQTEGEFSLTIPLPKGTKSRDLNVKITTSTLNISLKSNNTEILDHNEFNDLVKGKETSWYLSDDNLIMEFTKAKKTILEKCLQR